MIALLLCGTVLTASVSAGLTEKEAKKLSTFTENVSKFATAKGLSQEFRVAPGVPPRNADHANAWVSCNFGVCDVGVSQKNLRHFSGVALTYIPAHEVCHAAHHDGDGDIWGMMTEKERDERHRHVDVCVIGLIGKPKLIQYLFDSGMSDEAIDRYMSRLRWLTYRRYTSAYSKE